MRSKHATALAVGLVMAWGAWCGAADEPPRSETKRRDHSLALIQEHRAATTQQVLDSRSDLWGEAALEEAGGPTLEFFKDLLPPMRYVDARFRYYPIALGAPGAPIKARLVSNGSQINALANQPNWRNEVGLPVHIKVGREGVTFGEHLGQLEGPTYEQGYLPIVNLKYRHRDQVYQQEVFASCD